MNILVVLPRIPYPLTDGGAIGHYSFVQHLSKLYGNVTIATLNTKKHFQNPSVLESFGTVYSHVIDTSINAILLLFSLFSFTPYIVQRFYDKQFTETLKRIIEQHQINTVIIDSPFLGEYLIDLREWSPNLDIFLRTHNVEYAIHQRLSQTESWYKSIYYKISAKQLQQYEHLLMRLVQGVMTVSQIDKETFESIGVTTPIQVIPTCVDLQRFNALNIVRKPKSYFFFGSLDWAPNLEGLQWFIQNVFPIIAKAMPDSQFHIGGKNPPKELQQICKVNGIICHGMVPDANEFFHTYSLMVVPLLSGSGIRIKILEALSASTPMVTTSIGIEGIEFRGKSVKIEDNPEEFANAVITMLQNPCSKSELEEQRRFIQDHYEWDSVMKQAVGFMLAKKNQADRTL